MEVVKVMVMGLEVAMGMGMAMAMAMAMLTGMAMAMLTGMAMAMVMDGDGYGMGMVWETGSRPIIRMPQILSWLSELLTRSKILRLSSFMNFVKTSDERSRASDSTYFRSAKEARL